MLDCTSSRDACFARDRRVAPQDSTHFSAPVSCSWGLGRLDLFAIGAGGNLWHKWFQGTKSQGTWSNREGLGTPPGGAVYYKVAPAVCSWGAGRIDVFVFHWDNNACIDGSTTGVPPTGEI
ncbi:MAG: hypothetical protein LUP95_03655 [Euryarchaeota archaeon]|nr:hypothetical protein [Euryarchaeota archaeon]